MGKWISELSQVWGTVAYIHACNLVPRPSTPRFYLIAVEKNPIFLHGCKIKPGRGRPGYEVTCRCNSNYWGEPEQVPL